MAHTHFDVAILFSACSVRPFAHGAHSVVLDPYLHGIIDQPGNGASLQQDYVH